MTAANDSSNSWLEREKALLHLVGARLTSVQFVLDYLILGFDEKGALTTLVWPEVVQGASVNKLGSSGYRDRLCGLITSIVQSATIQADDTIEIQFDHDVELRIPLKTYAGKGERAILTAPKHFLRVF
jgi:hypothetical protein